MPRVQESTRRRSGGGGTMGIRGGNDGFYQRRGTGNTNTSWPDDDPPTVAGTAEHLPDAACSTPVKSAQSPLLAKAITVVAEAQPSNMDVVVEPKQATSHRMGSLKKNPRRKKKRPSRRSSGSLLEDDGDLIFGATIKWESKKTADSASLTPKSASNNSRRQEGAQRLPFVTPATTITDSSSKGEMAQTPLAAVSSGNPKKQTPEVFTLCQSARDTDPWQSPHPHHSQETPSLQPTIELDSGSGLMMSCQEEELQELQDSHRCQMEEQQRKHNLEMKEWKRRCQQEQATATQSLQQELKRQKQLTEKEHAKVLDEAVHLERTRITKEREDDKKNYLYQLGALQQQLDESNHNAKELIRLKLLATEAFNLRSRLMSQNIIELTASQRKFQKENDRQRVKLEKAWKNDKAAEKLRWALAASQKEACDLRAAQKDATARRGKKALPIKLEQFAERQSSVKEDPIVANSPMRWFEVPQPKNNAKEEEQPKAQKQRVITAADSLQSLSLPHLMLPPAADIRHADGTPETNLSFQSSNVGHDSNNKNRRSSDGGSSSTQPAHFKTLPRPRSSPKKKKSKDGIPIPSYDFNGMDMSEPFKPSKKQKLSRKRQKSIGVVVMDSP